MAGNWAWGGAQAQPDHPEYWQQQGQGHAQQVHSDYWHPQPAHNDYGHDKFLPTPSHPAFNNPLHSHHDPTSSLPGVHHHDDGLDEFDRQLLGMSDVPASHPQSSRRLTLPQAQPTISQASQPVNHVQGYSTSMLMPDHQQTVYHPGTDYPLHSSLPHFPVLSPATSTIPRGEPILRHQGLHHLQQITPPLQSTAYPHSHVQVPATPPIVSSSSDAGSLSPSAGVSLRRQSRGESLPQRQTASLSSQRAGPVTPPFIAPQEPPIAHGIRLVIPREALPDKFQSVFPHALFNAVQSKCFPSVYGSSDNLVVSAPTGSGKTVILELAICKLVADRGPDNIKIVYQAPTKALCSERAKDWDKKFSSLNLRCAELTGDTSQTEMRRVGSASIIVTTPEKWDSITRKWHDHRKLLQLVGLFLVDEVHILKDIRGATLEAVISRMKSIGTNVRFVALSATVPNSDDIATWLGLDHQNQHLPARLETFGEDFRPVRLERHVYGYDKRLNDHAFDKLLDSKIPPLLIKHTKGKPILVFCFTRNSCERTAANLAQWWTSTEKKPWHKPQKQIRVLSKDLQNLIQTGVAFHHAGLLQDDRQAIEQAFLDGELSVICCTSTLAVGVNLPCHTVVLKGTVTYQNDAIHELSDLEVMQMLGRAGRPQFDTSANALILTSSDQKDRYQRMVSGEEILESTLHLHLIEHLNSEVGLRTITDMDSAKKWLAGTFLSVRLRKNPDYYRLSENTSSIQDIDSMLKEICERDIKLLQDYEIITGDPVLKQSDVGGAMSKYMVEFNTMKLLLELPRALNMEQLLNALCKANEFREFKIKPVEAPIFREVNKSPFILYPINEPITKNWHKISLVVQLHLGGADFPDSSESQRQRMQLQMEKKGIFERLQRLARCVAECVGTHCDSVSTNTALELIRSLAAEAWEGRASELKQIPQIGPASMRKLVGQGVKAVKELAQMGHGQVEHLLSRNPPFGRDMSNKLKDFPLLGLKLDLGNSEREFKSVRGDPMTVPVMATLRYLNKTGLPKWKNKNPSATFVASTTSGVLIFFWKGSLNKLKNDVGLELRFEAKITAIDEQIVGHFSCEEIVGTIVTEYLHHKIPAFAFVQKRSQQPAIESMPDCGDEDGPEEPASQFSTDSSLFRDVFDAADDVQAAPGFLEVLEGSAATNVKNTQSQKTVESDNAYGDFPMVDDILDAMTAQPPPPLKPTAKAHGTPGTSGERVAEGDIVEHEPVKLANGKYQCNHACAGGALTKAGKKCSHRCCIEGLDKPRKLKPKTDDDKKRKPSGFYVDHDTKETSASTGYASSSENLGPAIKKRRLSQNPASHPDAPTTGWKATSTKAKANKKNVDHQSMFDYLGEHGADLSNQYDTDEDIFPSLATLASHKSKDDASGANRPNGEAYGSRRTGQQAGSHPLSAHTVDYEESVARAETKDFGQLDDVFGDGFDDDVENCAPSNTPGDTVARSNKAFVPNVVPSGAFKQGAHDAMFSKGINGGVASYQNTPESASHTPEPMQGVENHQSPSNTDDNAEPEQEAHDYQTLFGTNGTTEPKGAPSPTFQTQLDEASRWLDIDSQAMTPEDSDAFDEEPGSLTDGPTPSDQQLPSPDTTLDRGLGSDTKGAAGPSSSTLRSEKQQDEPSWVQDFDPEFVDMWRGSVNFV